MAEPPASPRWKQRLRMVMAQYVERDMRFSHLMLGAMVLLGLIVNLVLPHGWTVWPFVLAAAILLTVHELAERHGHGVPPLHVYAFFVGTMMAWLLIVVVISAVNPIVLLLGIGVLAYFALRGYLQQRAKLLLITARRSANLCIHCGHVIDPGLAFCEGCGEDPDPDRNRLQRVASAPGGKQRKEHLRSVLKPDAPTTIAQKKEQELLARRHRKRDRR